MCGISGFNWKDEGKIKTMVSSLDHRGPDAEGIFVASNISLGHNRLSIIDLSVEANQPMFDNENELVIVYSGEIYNFLELKKELEGEYDFKTKSDTEVILAGYRKWGKRVVERLNGMFALAIWNKRDQELFCARDHAGMKPFYYFWDGKRFIFASEIPAILCHDVLRKLDREAFNHYMRILYTPEPMTLLEDIYKLPPSHRLSLKNGTLKVEAYGNNISTMLDISYREAVSLVRGKVMRAVERHLISDVPVGVYLSGGIDSSTVLFSMSEFRDNIETFSIGFELKDKKEEGKFNHDFELARETAKYFGARHNPVIISTKNAIDSFEEVIGHNSDPISNPTSIAMYLLAREAKKKVSVALTGNAGDELFGGYERYRTALSARWLYNTGDLFAKFMFQKDDKLAGVMSREVFLNTGHIKRYFERYLVGMDAAEKLMNADRSSWLPDYFFMLSDHMSMSSALEERMPLADKELSLLAQALPRSFKVDMFRTKKILKDAFRKDLPVYLFNQPKRGWFSPAAKWFREPAFARLAREILSEDYYSGTSKLFDWVSIRKMLDKHINKEEYNLTTLWAILTFQAWARRYQVEI